MLSPDLPEVDFGCTNSKPRIHRLITVCIHGNELAGLHAVNELQEEGFFNTLDVTNRITIILGNPEAVKQRKRFVDINLNRIFAPSFILENSQDLFAQGRKEALLV